MLFKKNQVVVKVIEIMGHRTATSEKVCKATKKEVCLVDSSITYNPENGAEIDPPMFAAGIVSWVCPFDDGEVEKWGLS